MADTATPHLHVEFHLMPVQDVKASREQGRPIFKDVEHCHIRWAGLKQERELDEPAHQKFKRAPGTNEWITYAQAFPEHYRLFQLQQDQNAVNGTPLSEVPFLTEAKRAELRALNILSLEALAGLDGANLQRLGMGGRELKNQAQAWLDKAAGAAAEGRLAAELSARDDRIAALEAQIAALANSNQKVSHETNDSEADSPFKDFDDDALRAFIEDRSGKAPHHFTKRPKLLEMALAILAEEKAAAEQKAA